MVDRAFDDERPYPVRRWDIAINDPGTAALIKSTVATLPRGATLVEARLAVLDAVDPSDVDARELVDSAFDTLEKNAAGTARAAVRAIRVADPKQAVGPGVHLLNAHTGKGQQFDWVFVVGLEEGHIPDWRSEEEDSLLEEQRVLLVMLSRARHGLVMTRAKTKDGRYGPYPAKRSRWWNGIEAQSSTVEEIEAHLERVLVVP